MNSGTNGLAIVPTRRRRSIEPKDFFQTPLQGLLFPILKRNLAVVVRFPEVTDEEFKLVLEFAKPRLVADFRSVPTFSIGRLNRRLVFDTLKKNAAVYIEVLADPERQPEVNERMESVISEAWRSQMGPVVFLTHCGDSLADKLSPLIRKLIQQSNVTWDLLEIPQFR